MSFSIAQDDNIGSIGQLFIAPVYTLSALNPVITFLPGYDWIPIDFLEENAQLTDTSEDTDNGLQYTYNITLAFNKKREDLINSIAPYLGIVAVAKVIDNNGLTQIVGNLQSPISFKQNNDSGKLFTDMNNVLITGTVIQDTPAIMISN